MIVRASLRGLLHHRGRTLLALAGIGVSSALLVDMTMLASGLTHSFAALTRAQGYPVRVTPAGTLPFDSEAGISEAAAVSQQLREVPGVRSVAPVLGAQLYLVRSDSASEPLFTSGIDPAAQMLYLLVEGEEPGDDEIVVSGPLAEALGISVGDTVSLAVELDVALGRPRGSASYRISGVGDFLFNYAGERSVALPLARLQEITGRSDEVSLFAVAPAADADEEALVERISAAAPELSAYSTRDLTAALDQRLAYFRQLSTILGSISFGVATLLVATIVTIGVRERFGEIATLRAIGVAGHRVQIGIVVEGLALSAGGALLGLPIGLWMARRLDQILLTFPGIPARVSFFVFDGISVALAITLMVGIGALVGVIPGAQALRAPLGSALREEAD
ncbi:MAG: FtsX-like permease family protein [Gemmatimonas sp.]|nr:FtsX-like permease family protein [Gemmatimonas sp.]